MPPLTDTDAAPVRGRILEALTKERLVSFFDTLHDLLRQLRPAERLALYILTAVFALSALALLVGVNDTVSVTIPAHGGSLTEGELGPARFINPVIAISQPDQDLAALIYSGLMRATPDGTLVPDLASSYAVSTDGTQYTFTIRKGVTFHDGTAVTADDVVFTIEKAQESDIKSPHRADWEGVKVTAPDVRTVVFTLPHPYAPFIGNTTLGIVPKHLWVNVAADQFPFTSLNTHPVGSGPYQVSNVTTDQTGAATRYVLTPFAGFALGRPNLDTISFMFYNNQDALESAYAAGTIDAVAGLSPSDLSNLKHKDAAVIEAPLPRVFGIFFNQAHTAVLADLSVRSALDAAIDKQALVDTVLAGKGVPLDGPIPPGSLLPPTSQTQPLADAAASSTAAHDMSAHLAAARAILIKGGWTFDQNAGVWTNSKKQTLAFSLATADTPELVATANAVATQWRTLGVQVRIGVYSLADLNTTVIRSRDYDALLFGEVVGREVDLFAFWHSTQRMDPGLNLSLYANAKTDALLTQARATTDKKVRDSLYQQFAGIIGNDKPAVFLYAPDFLYVVPQGLHGVTLGALTTPAERFLDVVHWYTQTQRVWSIFADQDPSSSY